MKMKLSGAFAALLATALLVAPAAAQTAAADGGKQAGSILVRGRMLLVAPLNSSSSISVIGGDVKTTVSFTPEVDFSYFLTDNIALELIAATSQHRISGHNTAIGNPKVATTWVLPPALMAQYHFMPKSTFSPYVGAGINYTIFYNTRAGGGAVNSVKLDNNFGAVLQVGVDIDLGNRWFLNADVKQIFLDTKAKINGGAIVAKTSLNPTVVGLGFGYRF